MINFTHNPGPNLSRYIDDVYPRCFTVVYKYAYNEKKKYTMTFSSLDAHAWMKTVMDIATESNLFYFELQNQTNRNKSWTNWNVSYLCKNSVNIILYSNIQIWKLMKKKQCAVKNILAVHKANSKQTHVCHWYGLFESFESFETFC